MASPPSAPAVNAVLLAAPLSLAVALARRAPATPALRATGGKVRRGAALVAAAAVDDLRPAMDEYPEGILSGEWPENFSLLSYADLRAYLESQIVTSDKMSPTAKLGDVMSRPVQVATPGQRLAEIDGFFVAQSGLPVVDDEGRCIGVVSKKDKAKATNGLESTVGEVMSSPAITSTPEKTVLEAAALMLKEKVHRIPVLNEQQQVIGIVTRTDVFQALEANKA
uniref:CBS domain-containing protein n=1 Tax=Arundo donax TaxID=35708 RepID=A0A0A9DMK9_ARUDO